MTESEAKRQLQSEGYSNIHVWFDSPDFEYTDHSHAFATSHIILEGEMTVQMNDLTKTYRPDERVDVPAGVIHIAKVGPEGCTYVTGEKPLIS